MLSYAITTHHTPRPKYIHKLARYLSRVKSYLNNKLYYKPGSVYATIKKHIMSISSLLFSAMALGLYDVLHIDHLHFIRSLKCTDMLFTL